jgi:hypothetical protein
VSKRVGESWKLFGSKEPSEWKIQAARTKCIYLQDLEKYKKTDEYQEYQRYLVNFKLEHKSSSGANQGLSQCPMSRSSSNASIDVHQNGKVSGKAESWLLSKPSSYPSTKPEGYINSNTTCGQTLKEEDIDATHHSNLRSFDKPHKGFSTLQRSLVPTSELETGSLMPPPRFKSHAVPLQASHGHCSIRAIQPSDLVRETEQQHPGNSVGIATSTAWDMDERTDGNGSRHGSRHEHGQEPIPRRGGYFETVLRAVNS